MSAFSFNANEVKPDEGRQPPIPKGDYKVIMTESEIKPTSNGLGAYIAGKFKVVGGQFNDRTLFHNFNIRNQSEKAVEIGYAQLSALCHAVGVLNIQDTSQLHNRPLEVSVKVTPGQVKVAANPAMGTPEERYDDSNDITSFKKASMDQGASNAPLNIPPAQNQAPVQNTAPVQQPVQQQFQAPVQQPAQQAQPWEQPVQQQVQAPVQQQFQAPVQTEQPVQQQFQAPVAQQPWEQPVQNTAPVQQVAEQPAWAQADPVQPVQQQQVQNQAPIQQQADPAVAAGQQVPPPWAQ